MSKFNYNDLIKDHLRQLGLFSHQHEKELSASNKDKYLKWCSDNGFVQSVTKTPWDLKKELETYRTKVFTGSLKKSNAWSPDRPFREMIKGTDIKDIIWAHKDTFTIALRGDASQKETGEFLLELHKKTKILEKTETVRGVARLLNYHDFWIRELKDWKVPSYNAYRQLSSLIRHMLVKYDVPTFMDAAWVDTHETTRHTSWFISMGNGANIRSEPDLPYPLTKAMAHHFTQAPNEYTIDQALMYGQVMAEKGDKRLADSLRGTRIGQFDNEFRLATIRFLLQNPMLDRAQIAPILDYVYNQKYVRSAAADGVHRYPEPNFSFAGRTVDSLLAHMERWHRQLGKEKKGGNIRWEHSKWQDFKYEEGQAGTNSHKVWRITELLSSDQLKDEGRRMSHCVSSYASSCAAGRCSIWTMTQEEGGLVYTYLTIEVSNQGSIMQLRGIHNRQPTQQEMGIVRRWASKAGLQISGYIS